MRCRGRFFFDWGDVAAIGGLAVLVLILVAPALLPGRVLIPFDIVTEAWPPWQQPNQPVEVNNMLLADAVNYIVPVKNLLADSVRQGQLPLWNPYVLGGYPLTYNTQAGAFYPLTALYYFLPLLAVVDLVIILQMMLGALFMYAFLRQIKLQKIAAVVGAAIFIFNGLMMIWLEWQAVHAAIIWLPLQLLLAERMVIKSASDDPAASRTVYILSILCGVSLAIPWLGGHWNWTLYTSMTLAAYLLWRMGPLLRERRTWQERRALLQPTVLIFLVGLGLALVQVLPAFDYLSQSHRQPSTFPEARERSLLNRFVVMLIPNFFGSPVDDNWWGPQNFAETTFFVGLLPLFLTNIAAFTRRDRIATFFISWGLLGLFWSLGEPGYRMLHILPIFNGFFPSRAAIVPLFAVAVLSAMGLDCLMKSQSEDRKRYRRIVLGTFAVLFILAGAYFLYYRADVGRTWEYLQRYTMQAALFMALSLALIWLRLSGRLRPGPFALLALLVIIADLFLFGYRYNTISSTADWFPENGVTSFLQADDEPNRIVTTAAGIVFPPNSSMIFGLHNISGYEPGILQRTVDYMNTAEGENAVRAERVLMPKKGLDSGLLDAANVKYIVTTHDLWQEEPVVGLNQDIVDQWLPLSPGSAIEQRFTVYDAGLHRLDLRLRTSGTEEGTVTARILTADGVLPLAHDEISLAEMDQGEWLSFFFSPFSSEWGRSFLLQVEYNGDGQVLLGASGEDLLPDTELLVEGEARGDLAFTTYYFPRPNLVFEEGTTRIYLNEDYFERAFFVPEAIIAKTPEEALEGLKTHQNELDQLAILELANQPEPPDLGSGPENSGTIKITSYDLNRVELHTSNDAAGFLLLADTYYPGWRARLDGEPTPVYQADYLFRAIYLPPGDHLVEFSFLPPDFVAGAVISGATLIACLVGLVIFWQKRGKRTEKESREMFDVTEKTFRQIEP